MGIRTTVTLDEDVYTRLRQRSRERGQSFKEAINETVRDGLLKKPPLEPFVIVPHDLGLPAVPSHKTEDFFDALEGLDRKW
jgi:hypothetical protein